MFGRLMCVNAFSVFFVMLGSLSLTIYERLAHPESWHAAMWLTPFIAGGMWSVLLLVFQIVWQAIHSKFKS